MPETLKEFIERNKIDIEVFPTHPMREMSNDPKWDEEANHYVVELRMDDEFIETTYSTGRSFDGEPTPELVLDSLLSDATMFLEHRTRKSYESEFGPTGYEECGMIAAKLLRFFGGETFDYLRFNVDR